MSGDGRTVTVWTSTCKDCGFVSGLAEVRWPNGDSVLLSGAGCFTRRGPREAKAWADSVQRVRPAPLDRPDGERRGQRVRA